MPLIKGLKDRLDQTELDNIGKNQYSPKFDADVDIVSPGDPSNPLNEPLILGTATLALGQDLTYGRGGDSIAVDNAGRSLLSVMKKSTTRKDLPFKGDRGYDTGTEFRSKFIKGDNSQNPSKNEPYITDSIPSLDATNPGAQRDFILRGGTLDKTGRDLDRIGQFMASPKGVAFAAKQNALSATDVKTQGAGTLQLINGGVYLPTSTLAQVGAVGFGGHLNKQGTNPTRSTQGGGNPLGAFINNLDPARLPVYLDNIGNIKEKNRLVNLKDAKLSPPVNYELNTGLLGGSFFQQLKNFAVDKIKDTIDNIIPSFSENSISNNRNEILKYDGGPGSEGGIGKTIIKRATDTQEWNTQTFRSKYYFLSNSQLSARATLSQESGTGTIQGDFRQDIAESQTKGIKKNILGASPDYTTKNIDRRLNMDFGNSQKDVSNYAAGLNNGAKGAADKVNAMMLYQSGPKTQYGPTTNPAKNDIIKLRIGVRNTKSPLKKTYIHLRAFVDSFKDSYSANYNKFNLLGRSEEYYKYKSFNRSISMKYSVQAMSKEELIPQFIKANYLASTLAGDYTDQGYLASNVCDITLGSYLFEQPAIITKMDISIPNNSPWEIALPPDEASTFFNTNQVIPSEKGMKEMPHRFEVSLTFTPLHEFSPRKQQNLYDGNGQLSTFGKEKYIKLAAQGEEDGYTDFENNIEGFDPADGSEGPISRRRVGSVEIGDIEIGDPLSTIPWSSNTLIESGFNKVKRAFKP